MAAILVAGVACEKEEVFETPAPVPCGCTVTQSGPEGTISVDVPNAEIQAEYPGLVGCGNRADQAQFKLDLGEEILYEYGEEVYAAWLLNVDVVFTNFYCN